MQFFCNNTLYWAAVYANAISSDVVGYNNTAARANLNWYAPCFRSIGVNTTDINDIKLDDGGAGNVGWGDNMQIVGPLGNATTIYCYWDPSMDMSETPKTTYYGGDDAGTPVEVSLDEGDGVAIDNGGELEYNILGAGEVSTNEVSFAANANLNWSGNPFPMSIDINSVKLDDGGAGNVGWGDNMQIVGPLGNATTIYCYWDPSMDMSETPKTTYYWGDDAGTPVEVQLDPGAGFAIDNGGELEYTIKIECK